MKQIYALMLMLMMASVAFTGCVSDDSDDAKDTTTDSTEVLGCMDSTANNYNADATKDDASCTFDATTEDVLGCMDSTANNYNADATKDDASCTFDPVGSDTQSTLDAVIAAGNMKCGVKTSQFGMGYLADDGTRSGLDIEYCRALAAAIGLDPDTEITYVLATGSNRFELLASGDIDVLIRTTTWTTSRDADLNADFAGINFYDGQGMLVNMEAHPGADSVMDLDSATVCVGIGTTTEGNLADYFQVNSLAYTAVNSADAAAAKASFADGSCTAWTGDMSAMVAQKWGIEQAAEVTFDMAIMPELMSKEPLGAATRDNDADWNDVVTWVWYGMLTAEELGVDSTNYASQNLSNPAYNRLLNSTLGLGTEANPLSPTWMQSVLATTGNYAEAYDRSFCDGTGAFENCLIDRAGTQNAPYWAGGLQYAPPMR